MLAVTQDNVVADRLASNRCTNRPPPAARDQANNASTIAREGQSHRCGRQAAQLVESTQWEAENSGHADSIADAECSERSVPERRATACCPLLRFSQLTHACGG
jgi:hypothetical protein